VASSKHPIGGIHGVRFQSCVAAVPQQGSDDRSKIGVNFPVETALKGVDATHLPHLGQF